MKKAGNRTAKVQKKGRMAARAAAQQRPSRLEREAAERHQAWRRAEIETLCTYAQASEEARRFWIESSLPPSRVAEQLLAGMLKRLAEAERLAQLGAAQTRSATIASADSAAQILDLCQAAGLAEQVQDWIAPGLPPLEVARQLLELLREDAAAARRGTERVRAEGEQVREERWEDWAATIRALYDAAGLMVVLDPDHVRAPKDVALELLRDLRGRLDELRTITDSNPVGLTEQGLALRKSFVEALLHPDVPSVRGDRAVMLSQAAQLLQIARFLEPLVPPAPGVPRDRPPAAFRIDSPGPLLAPVLNGRAPRIDRFEYVPAHRTRLGVTYDLLRLELELEEDPNMAARS